MQIKCSTFLQMSEEIKKNNLKIAMFGAGVIGTVTAPEILSAYDLLSYLDCYLDNDSRKCGTEIEVYDKKLKVYPLNHLSEADSNTLILLNISRYADVLEQLEQMECTKDMSCYIMPMMCIHNFRSTPNIGAIQESNHPLIPKKIHYMWLGGKPIPANLQKCMDSWEKYCPDYEIIRWDESNYDIAKNEYMKQAYENKAYGFVPDYARIDILYQYGGIYLDTDVELIKSLDELLYQQAFCGVEKWQVINFGGCSGAVKGHAAVDEFRKEREQIHFLESDGTINRNTCGFYDTNVALRHGYQMNGKNQNILGMNIYAYDYFHPYDYMSGHLDISDNTFSIHHFNGGWLDEKMKQANEESKKRFNTLYQSALQQST